MERNSFIFYKGWREAIKDLPDDVRLEIYESIIEYATTGNLRGLKPMANIAFNFIKIDIDRDTEKYMSIVERNKSNGSKGGRPKSENPKEPKEPTKPTGLFGNPKEPTKPDNDNEYDNDYVDDNDSHLKKKETSPKGESKKDELSLFPEEKIDWVYDEKQCEWKITPYNEFCTPEKTYRQIYVELYHTFYLEIRRGIPENFSKEEFVRRIIPQNMSKEQWMFIYGQLNAAINNIYSEHEFGIHKGKINIYPVHINTYDYLCLNAIKIYFEQNNFKPIAEACAKAADHCFAPYKNQLGTYFRNAYYILEMTSEFTSPLKYSNIFRAQLSKYELVLLFFNSFSSLSTIETRRLYLNADLFNNLELKDVRLKEGINDESVSRRMEYIHFPPVLFQKANKNEYMSSNLLEKLYNVTLSENNIL